MNHGKEILNKTLLSDKGVQTIPLIRYENNEVI